MLRGVPRLIIAGATSLQVASLQPGGPCDPRGMSISELQAAMASGEITARALCEYYIRRIHAIDSAGPRLNCVLEINPDALATADRLDAERASTGISRGKMHGIPVLVKDNIDTAGLMRTTAGSLALCDCRPAADAHVVSLLRAQGAIILGKANLSEWGNFRGRSSVSGWSAVGGQTKNPHVTDRNPNGSSSGSAAAVAAGLCPVAIGTETNGSIVAPASACGVVGIKPTVGLTSRSGVVPISSTQDSVGTFGATVADAATALEAIVGIDKHDSASSECPATPLHVAHSLSGACALKGARVGVLRQFYEEDARSGAVCEEAVKALEAAGATVVEVSLSPAVLSREVQSKASAEDEVDDEVFVLMYEMNRGMAEYLATRVSLVGELEPLSLPDSQQMCRSLEDLVTFNKAHSVEELSLFGQEHFERAAGLTGAAAEARYNRIVASNTRKSRGELDTALDLQHLDVLLAPSGPPTWDNNNKHEFYFASCGHAAVAGYPLVTSDDQLMLLCDGCV